MAPSRWSPFQTLARLVYRRPVLVYCLALLVPALLAIGVAQYDVRIDTGILSFRARDEPYAVTYDAVLAALQWGKQHTRYSSGPPAPPASTNAPPAVPDVERLQSHVTYWLTTVYETHPPGGNVLEQSKLDFIKRVELAVTSVAGFASFCKKVPTQRAWDLDREACGHWVPPGTQDACSSTLCSTPMSLISFEQFIRTWFEQLASQALLAPNATVAIQETRAELVALGFSEQQAIAFARALVDQPEIVQSFQELPLVDLLKLVPKGALTKDLFRIGHEPGWFFDRFYATGVGEGGENTRDDDTNANPDSSQSNRPSPHAVALRSGFEFALPLPGYATATDRREEQDVLYRKWAASYTKMFEPGGYWEREAAKAGMRVLHAGGGISEDEAGALVLGDLKFAAGAFGLVFVCILVYTRSAWVTTNAVLGVALAFPSAFFFVRATSDSKFVSFLNVLVPFVLIGIGCDDAMVMCDAFKAASSKRGGKGLPSEDAFVTHFACAAKAMLATSLTTAVAFGSNVFSYIPPVRSLGLYAASTVVANYVLVLTLLPAALLIESNGFRETASTALAFRKARNAKYQALGAEVELQQVERVEVLQTTRGSSLTNTSEEIDVQVHVSNGDAKEQDTGPSAVVGWSESMDAVTKPGDHHGTFSRVATEALGKFVIARRVGILFFSAVSVLIASAVVANGLVVAETPPPLLRPDTNLQRIQHLLFDVFYTENWSNVRVAFGVKGVDRSSADPNDPMSFGTPVFDENFDFKDARVQRGVLAACDVIKNNARVLAFTKSAGPEECVLQAFVRDFTAGSQSSDTSGDTGSNVSHSSSGNASDSSGNVPGSITWGPALPVALAAWSATEGRAWRENLGWSGYEGRSALTFITADYFVDLHPVSSTSSEIRAVHAAWQRVLLEANAAMAAAVAIGTRDATEGTEGVDAGSARDATGIDDENIDEGSMHDGTRSSDIKPPLVFQACDVWNRLGVEESIRHTAWVSPPVSFVAAAVITFGATGSARVTAAALVTIACAVVLMLAALVAVGWQFGVVEELCVTLLIGASIDYCIHLAMAYAEAGAVGLTRDTMSNCAEDTNDTQGIGGNGTQDAHDTQGIRGYSQGAGDVTHSQAASSASPSDGSRTRREEKLKSALTNSAPTITGAATTTAVSCAMLLFCEVEVLVKIGATIVANTVVGYVLTLGLFSALVATVGD